MIIDIYCSVQKEIADCFQQGEETDECCDGDHQGAGILIGGDLPLLQTCECPRIVTLPHLVGY